VLGVDDPAAIGAGEAGERAPVVLCRVPEPTHDLRQLVGVVAAIGDPVELPVEHEESFDVVGVDLDLGLDLLQLLDVGRGQVRERLAEQQGLQLLAHPIAELAVAQRHRGHPGPGVRLESDQAGRLEDAQRLAHRQAARAQLVGDLVLDDARAGRESSVEDALAHLVGDTAAGNRRRRGCLNHLDPPAVGSPNHLNASGSRSKALPSG
jgi:hypothetical protein